MMDDVREKLAEYAHAAWSGWMEYLFKAGTTHGDGSFTIHPWAVERWTRQMRTPYAELCEGERLSDRAEADRMLAIVTTDAFGSDNARLRAEVDRLGAELRRTLANAIKEQ